MNKSHEMIPSEAMGRRVHLWRYGHFGQPLVVFPSAAGMAHEWEAHEMTDALAPLINSGKLKLYTVESNVAEVFTRKEGTLDWRMQRAAAYETFVVEELVRYIREDSGGFPGPLAVTGCSLGAMYSANMVLKHPETFNYALCMSGRYDARGFTDGQDSADLYFHNPLAYVPNLNGDDLDRVRSNAHLTLVCGQGRFEEGNIEETQAFGDLLASKGISCKTDLWGRDVAHQWPWWQKQAIFHLGNRYGR